MKIALILGTRPEIIKMSPIIRLFEEKNIDYLIIHSNQHYSKNMDDVFFKELNLPTPDYSLGIGSADHGNQTGNMLIKIEEILLKEKPDVVLSQGDTNTVLAGILAASKQNIKTGHVEAGLRSYDRRMPEEKNRIICDTLSDYLFVPTRVQKEILLGEGIPENRIFVTGNTIVDAVLQHKELAMDKSKILSSLDLQEKQFVLLTAHRALNVDTKESLEKLVNLIGQINEITGFKVVYPMHPRTKAKLDQYNLNISNAICIEPLGYLDFLALEINAGLIVTDSGGIQEEACILGIPCITIRENTERPETISVGANKLVGLSIDSFKKAFKFHQNNTKEWENPFGSGHTSEKILEVIKSQQ
ncbi:UDP-N-acetylglucosamine 2-epimerase (non-hydrolyzing) [Thermoplasmatales archaeon ex4572_165]|nr:MAG: UDP-N-acetylglucosamine 2-epimerase (non-hydrolyzing) [Thermoplasmatales archaeon ex4572_165]